MIDAILYVADFHALVAHLDTNYPELLERDEQGSVTTPPVVTGFARTPATTIDGGHSLAAYARLRDAEADQWRGMPHVQVLAEAPFEGRGTADAVYAQVFDDPDLLAIYDSVYDRTPREVDDGKGGTITVTPPDRFGIIAGA